jgi:DedD protein
MEKKKLLLVAVSVGVFLLVVISAAILIFSPNSPTGTVISAVKPIPAGIGAKGIDGSLKDIDSGAKGIDDGAKGIDGGANGIDGGASLQAEPIRVQPATLDAADMIRNADDLQGLLSPPSVTVIQENSFHITGDRVADDGSGVVIGIPAPSTAAVPRTTKTTAEPVKSTAPAAPVTPAAAPARTTPAAAVKPVAAAPKPAPAPVKVHNDYWVQTGAFAAKVRAEGVKETLASKGIISIIDDRKVNGEVMFRVRVGPYTSETEASYWLALVKTIDGFADSQIRISTRSN